MSDPEFELPPPAQEPERHADPALRYEDLPDRCTIREACAYLRMSLTVYRRLRRCGMFIEPMALPMARPILFEKDTVRRWGQRRDFVHSRRMAR